MLRNVLRPEVLLGSVLLASPALWMAFVDGTLETGSALGRLGVAVLLCAGARALFVAAVRVSAPSEAELVEDRRRESDVVPGQAAHQMQS